MSSDPVSAYLEQRAREGPWSPAFPHPDPDVRYRVVNRRPEPLRSLLRRRLHLARLCLLLRPEYDHEYLWQRRLEYDYELVRPGDPGYENAEPGMWSRAHVGKWTWMNLPKGTPWPEGMGETIQKLEYDPVTGTSHERQN